MRNIPVDTSQMVFIAAGSPRPKVKDRQTGEIKYNADGSPVWQLKVLAQVEDNDAETLLVSFPATQAITARLGTPLTVQGLTAIPWETNGRHGVAFSASSIAPLDLRRAAE
ncbi:SCO3933 family regulatory protein [Nocardiopsis dassonvillei]|uniref:SCO3933 family regulatory protein n=1 Tax=Nocardiopsis dassonvillei TaxID=2014 RepID=UPI0036718911